MLDDMTRLLTEGLQKDVIERPAKSHLRAWLAAVLLLAYLGVVLAATLSPTPLDQGYSGSIAKVLDVLHRNGLPGWFGYGEVEFTANVLMFIPLGFLAGLALPDRVAWLALLLVPAASVAVEWAQGQFLAQRFSTLQDVIANTVGGLIGVLVAFAVRAMVHARDRKVVERALWDARFGGGYRR